MLTLEFQGMAVLLRTLQRLGEQAQDALVVAVQQDAEDILEASIPLVPVDTGLLVSTGLVEQEPQGATIRYGGHGLAPYALVVHEDVTMHHPNGGQAKYLQQPVLAALDGMPARLGRQLAPGLARA